VPEYSEAGGDATVVVGGRAPGANGTGELGVSIGNGTTGGMDRGKDTVLTTVPEESRSLRVPRTLYGSLPDAATPGST
jgi:hypothetical protein